MIKRKEQPLYLQYKLTNNTKRSLVQFETQTGMYPLRTAELRETTRFVVGSVVRAYAVSEDILKL